MPRSERKPGPTPVRPNCTLVEDNADARRLGRQTQEKDSYYAAEFSRLRSRRGLQKAICAVAASLLTAIYHMVNNGSAHRVQTMSIAAHPTPTPNVRSPRLSKFGYKVTPQQTAEAA